MEFFQNLIEGKLIVLRLDVYLSFFLAEVRGKQDLLILRLNELVECLRFLTLGFLTLFQGLSLLALEVLVINGLFNDFNYLVHVSRVEVLHMSSVRSTGLVVNHSKHLEVLSGTGGLNEIQQIRQLFDFFGVLQRKQGFDEGEKLGDDVLVDQISLRIHHRLAYPRHHGEFLSLGQDVHEFRELLDVQNHH